MSSRPQPLETVPDDLDMILKMAEASMGFVPNSMRTMAKRPGLLKASIGMFGYMVGPDCTIDAGLRQMVAYMTSYGAGCRYCQAHTSHGAENAGVKADKIENLWQFETSDLFDDRERAALSFALAAGQVPNAVEDAHYDALAPHFSEEEILDLVAIISIFGFLNRWNDTMGTPLEDAPVAFAASHLTDSGWQAGKHGT